MANGSCLCGEVKYSFTGTPVMQALCHCLPCRKVSGSAYTTNLLVPSTLFTFLSGSSKLKSFSTLHPSGMTLTIHFCEKCGTKIYKEGSADDFKGLFIVQAGTLDGGEGGMGLGDVEVGAELWVKDRVAWVPARGGPAQMQEFS
ncbi:Mss4-like protein [Leptodontidium sp. 2 PMI_412]|nr:Mss4-like protein [Leptodontidium sp. 2 PMI_412]